MLITRPQQEILSLAEDGTLHRTDIIQLYQRKGYSEPQKSASATLKKLVDNKLIKRARTKGVYLILNSHKPKNI